MNQDRVFTIIIVLKLLEMYEEENEELGSNTPHYSIHSCIFLLVVCLGCMRVMKRCGQT